MKDDNISIEETLVLGSGNRCTIDPNDTSKPLVVRGVIKKHHVDNCIAIGRDFYYIDTGYVGNFPSTSNPSGKKIWHSIVKNENQHSVIREVPTDRWNTLTVRDPRLPWRGWKHHNKKILLVLPNPKACKYYNLDYDTWISDTTTQIKKYSDLPIEVRIKGARSERSHGYSIYDAFDSGVYATVAMNSIAALESVLYGVPAFVSVPCAASPLASTDLSKLGNPFFPDEETIKSQCANIAYGQFTLEEIQKGIAWDLIQKY
jgi:hypothetical protein